MSKSFLFIGGPLHGKIRAIMDYGPYRVPVATVILNNLDLNDTSTDSRGYTTKEYRLRPFTPGGIENSLGMLIFEDDLESPLLNELIRNTLIQIAIEELRRYQ